MSPETMASKSTVTKAISPEQLATRASALGAAVQAGGDELDGRHSQRARTVVDKVEQRTALVGGHTVVALSGATGSGKSSLFNAIVADDVAVTGARRPTTSTAAAAIWGDEPVNDLLEWLRVGKRHHVPKPRHGRDHLDGLVLLDLPDFDSRESSNRAEAERVLDLTDVFCWVTDPQKYADARLHDDYVSALATHEAVMLVVLNQADRLTPAEIEECSSDLKRLFARDGIPDIEVIPTSAKTGMGIEELKERLTTVVEGHNAARQRLTGDIAQVAGTLRDGVADSETDLDEKAGDDLVEALARAAGVPTVVHAVERDFLHESISRTGWPFTRWIRAFRPDPLGRLRLDKDKDPLAVNAADVRSVLGRSSLPPPTPAARSAVDLATRQLGDKAAHGLPHRWAEAVHSAASPPGPQMADELDLAVIGTSLRARNPIWWTVVGALQLLGALALIVGLVWLLVLAVMGYFQLPELPTPEFQGLPVPTLLVAAGLLLGLVLSLLARLMARAGAQRRANAIDKRLHRAIAGVAGEHIVEPVRDVLTRHAETRRQLDIARGAR
ncbi:GTPase [Actinomycetota bacterium]